TGQTRPRVLPREVVVAPAGADRADLRVVVERRLVDGAGVVVQAPGDGEVEPVVALRHPERTDQGEHLTQLGDAFGQREAAAGRGADLRQPGERVVVAGGPHLHENQDLVDDLVGEAEARPGQRGPQGVGRPFVELVYRAQDRRLLVGVGDPQVLVEPAQQLAVVQLDGEGADGQVGEDRVNDGGALRVVAYGQLVLADDVDVALVELAEPAPLRA